MQNVQRGSEELMNRTSGVSAGEGFDLGSESPQPDWRESPGNRWRGRRLGKGLASVTGSFCSVSSVPNLPQELPAPPRHIPQRLLPAPPNGVSPASHTQVGGWTVDPVCLLSSLCSHLHGDSAPSGAGQPAQVSHPSPPTPQTHGRLGLWGDFFGKGRSRILILHPFLLCGACIFRRLQCPVLSPDSLIPTIPSPKEKGKC